jgi:hypothetical protein
MPNNFTKPNGTNKNGKPQFKINKDNFLYNVDTLYYSAYAENFNEVMNSGFRDFLEGGKENAQKFESKLSFGLDLHKYNYPVTFDIEGFGKTTYSYQIRNEDYAFYFMKEYDERNSAYPIYVQINQFKLWSDGVLNAYMETQEILYLLGFKVTSNKPSRIDLCCHSDQFKWTVPDLRKFKLPPAMKNPSFEHLDVDTLEFETVYYGTRGRLQMRIYNKSVELLDKNKFHFIELYEKHGLNPREVWNVEFEVHRDYLKNLCVNGEKGFYDEMDNLLSDVGLSTLWTHLTRDKFYHDSVFWRTMSEGGLLAPHKLSDGDSKFVSRFYQSNAYLDRLKDIDDSKEREVAQIRGRLQKLILNKDVEFGSELNEAIKEFLAMVFDYEEKKGISFIDDLYRKRSKFVNQELNNLTRQYNQLLGLLVRLDKDDRYMFDRINAKMDEIEGQADLIIEQRANGLDFDSVCLYEALKELRKEENKKRLNSSGESSLNE